MTDIPTIPPLVHEKLEEQMNDGVEEVLQTWTNHPGSRGRITYFFVTRALDDVISCYRIFLFKGEWKLLIDYQDIIRTGRNE